MKYIELYEGIFSGNFLKKEVIDFIKEKENKDNNHNCRPKDYMDQFEVNKIKRSLKSLKSTANFSYKIDLIIN